MDESNPTNSDLPTNSNDTAVFDLQLTDSELLGLIRRPLIDSESYWNKTFDLDKVRRRNVNLWLPNHYKNKEVYDYQEEYLYQNPRIFIAVETICSVVNARIPAMEVMPAEDNMVSTQLAEDLQKIGFAHSEKFRVQDIFRISVRNLLLKRVGWVKLRFDPNVGKDGEIVPEHVLPEDIIVDQDAKWGEIPRFIAQRIRNKTGEELLSMFPDSKQKVYELIGVNRFDTKGNRVAYKSQLGKKNNIMEVWFRFWDDKKKQYSGGLAFTDENFQIVLEKDKNPNWNYEEESKGAVSNLLDFPAPPFIPLNYLNDGTSYIDLTSMVEQASSMQQIADRRGFQIMESAEMAGSGLIFNTLMIKKEDIAKLTGSPDERIGVKGKVGDAVMRVAPPPLPNYVIEDKQAALDAIDDIFGVHDVTRGDKPQTKTLGQSQIQVQQDYTRMDDIARSVERMATQYYRYLVQMMKVYYTEDHYFKATGEDGQFDFVVMRNDLIEDGIDVSVEAGSTLPVNKQQQQAFITELATAGLIDPLTIYEVGSGSPMPSPKKMLERYMGWKTDPMAFLGKTKEDEFDRKAFMDIQILNDGKMPEPRDEISPEYLKFMNNYMLSGDFNEQTDLVKSLYIEWMNICKAQAQQQLEMLMTQAPTPEDMQNANNQAVQQAGVEQQLNAAQPPMPGEGGGSAQSQALAARGAVVTPQPEQAFA